MTPTLNREDVEMWLNSAATKEMLGYLGICKKQNEQSLLEIMRTAKFDDEVLSHLYRIQGQLVVIDTILNEDFFYNLIVEEKKDEETTRTMRL